MDNNQSNNKESQGTQASFCPLKNIAFRYIPSVYPRKVRTDNFATLCKPKHGFVSPTKNLCLPGEDYLIVTKLPLARAASFYNKLSAPPTSKSAHISLPHSKTLARLHNGPMAASVFPTYSPKDEAIVAHPENSVALAAKYENRAVTTAEPGVRKPPYASLYQKMQTEGLTTDYGLFVNVSPTFDSTIEGKAALPRSMSAKTFLMRPKPSANEWQQQFLSEADKEKHKLVLKEFFGLKQKLLEAGTQQADVVALSVFAHYFLWGFNDSHFAL